jgi:hypothetical protein
MSATTAGAMLALVAIAMTVSAQGASAAAISEALTGSRPMLRETATAREFAAVVTAVVRDMVGHDTICGAACECCYPLTSNPLTTLVTAGCDDEHMLRTPPIAPRLLNIPPPTN